MGFAWENKLVQARWSGEAAWIPLGALDLGLNYENHTSFPAPGGLSTPAATARRRSCFPTVARASRVSSDSLPATTF